MIVLELDDIEIDHCLSCKGIWLDAGELELLLGDAEKKDELLNSFQVVHNAAEEARKCPICLKEMQKVVCGTNKDGEILIDECPQKDGLWFDAGELEEIVKMGTFDKDRRVLELLNNMFGKK
jgi:hypothetical protein